MHRTAWVERGCEALRRLDLPTAVALLVLVLGATQLIAGALSTGVTIDEPIEAEETQSWIDHGWYLPSYLMVDGEPDPNSELASPYVYGPSFGAISHTANVIAGNESGDEISSTEEAYVVRHLVAAALAAIAVGAVGAAVAFLTRSRRFGLWAAAGLLAVPAWTGHGFFNPKDIPAGTGYTLITVGLLIALCDASSDRIALRRRLAIGALLASGFYIGAGTRLALLVPFLLSILAYALLRFGQWRLGGISRDGETDFAVGMGAAVGLGAIAISYQNVAAKPFTLLAESVSSSAGYPWQGFTLTAGQLVSENPPWWYLPTWIGASYPLLLGALAIVGASLGIRSLVRARGPGWQGALWGSRDLGLLLVLQQALMLPLAAIFSGIVMYSGMRQHLYVLPAIAILAGVGAAQLWRRVDAGAPLRAWRTAVAVLLAAALLVPTIEQGILFPYNYAYVNPAAGIGGVDDRWETDYWVASLPEALSRVPENAEMRCYLVMPTVPCEEDEIVPFEDQRGTAVADRWRSDTSATWVIVRKHAANQPPEGCEQADDVTRWLRGEAVTMSFVLRCDPESIAGY